MVFNFYETLLAKKSNQKETFVLQENFQKLKYFQQTKVIFFSQ